jgi:DNA-binding MarR family transcriptional regulator
MTRIVQSLERDGYVQRDSDPSDGRIVRLNATARGKRVMQQGRQRRVQNLAHLLGGLSPREIAKIQEAAELIEEALRGR